VGVEAEAAGTTSGGVSITVVIPAEAGIQCLLNPSLGRKFAGTPTRSLENGPEPGVAYVRRHSRESGNPAWFLRLARENHITFSPPATCMASQRARRCAAITTRSFRCA